MNTETKKQTPRQAEEYINQGKAKTLRIKVDEKVFSLIETRVKQMIYLTPSDLNIKLFFTRKSPRRWEYIIVNKTLVCEYHGVQVTGEAFEKEYPGGFREEVPEGSLAIYVISLYKKETKKNEAASKKQKVKSKKQKV